MDVDLERAALAQGVKEIWEQAQLLGRPLNDLIGCLPLEILCHWQSFLKGFAPSLAPPGTPGSALAKNSCQRDKHKLGRKLLGMDVNWLQRPGPSPAAWMLGCLGCVLNNPAVF